MSNKDGLTNKIRRLRFDNDEMTQQKLAELAKVSRQTIIAVESGKYTPSLALGMRIARVFEKTVDEVFELE